MFTTQLTGFSQKILFRSCFGRMGVNIMLSKDVESRLNLKKVLSSFLGIHFSVFGIKYSSLDLP
jgi:hypothetical protein